MPTRRWRGGAAVAVTAVLALSACGSGDGPGPADLAGKDVGAMAGYAAGAAVQGHRAALVLDPLQRPRGLPDQGRLAALAGAAASAPDVTFEPVVVPRSDYEEKRSLVIGAGDAPLIIPKTYHPNQEDAFVASGTILPVSDYLDLMPNFQDKVQQWDLGAHLDTLRQADGKFYLLPGLHEAAWQDYSLAMRTDVLAKLGLATPTTWDEVHDVLTAIKRAHPDSYPLSDREDGKILLNMVGMTFGTQAGTDWGWESPSWDADAGRFVFTGTTPEYKADGGVPALARGGRAARPGDLHAGQRPRPPEARDRQAPSPSARTRR